MLAYGKLSRELMVGGFSQGQCGFEFAGLLSAPPPSHGVSSSHRIMGIARQAIATKVGAPDYLVSGSSLSFANAG